MISTRDGVTVELIQQVGGDESVIASARVSTFGDISLEAWQTSPSEARGLINFLMKNRHGTPFEHNSFTFYIKAPIFVFREFHRHRIGWSYNEESGRYKQLSGEFYVPQRSRPLVQVGKVGSYEFVSGTDTQHAYTVDLLTAAYEQAYAKYEDLLRAGIAKEVARMCLPVGIYSSMYATCNARSLMAYLSLRTEDERANIVSKPMKEIQMVSWLMEKMFGKYMPLTYEAFNNNGRQAP